MGPLRRGLIAIGALLFASPAWAEVCDKERPNWNGVQPTAWAELIQFAVSPAALIGFAALTIAWIAPWRVLALISMAWGLLLLSNMVLPLSPGFDGIRSAAINEGCIGPQHLSMVLCTAICIASLARLFWPAEKEK